MICIPVTARDNESALQQIQRAAPLCDIIELRLDFIDTPNVERLVAACPRPAIATCRAQRDGGAFTGEETDRLDVLRRAAKAGAEYVDIEVDCVASLGEVACKRIVSFHDFDKTPPNLMPLYRRIAQTGADVVKIATKANSILDNLVVFEMLSKACLPAIGLCMGEYGQISRILAGRFGGLLTFASLDDSSASAPGQLMAGTLRDLYRYQSITAKTDLYGVIANPVGHSMSPAIHNAAFAELGMDAVYLPLLVDDPVEFFRAFRPLGFNGYSVTIPHKLTSIPAMDEVDAKVAEVGALNTVAVEGGRLTGHNVEWLAAIEAMEQGIGSDATFLKGRRALVIGAGGAARAICVGLRERQASITITNRTAGKARDLAALVGGNWLALDDLGPIDADVVINTTSVGMYPNIDACPIDPALLKPGTVVYDIVYNPFETRLLREARSRGCQTVPGLGMFVMQAANQFRLWTGQEPPLEIMTEVVRAKLNG